LAAAALGIVRSMLHRRATRSALAVASSLALAGGLAAGCGSSSKSPASTSAASAAVPSAGAVALAADKTTAAGGAHVTIGGSFTVPGASAPLSLNGNGAFSFANREGQLTLTISGLPAQSTAGLGGNSLQLNEIAKGNALYVGSPLLAGRLPGGAKWLKVSLSQVAQTLGFDPSSVSSGGANPATYLQDLRAAGGTVKVVGHETVRGAETTRYSATVDLLKVAEANGLKGGAASHAVLRALLARLGLHSIPVEAWVDGQGLVRKVAVHFTSHSVTASITAEYFDFGPQAPVNAPAPAEVFEVSGQMLQSLTAGG
jgi:hypothetical protein